MKEKQEMKKQLILLLIILVIIIILAIVVNFSSNSKSNDNNITEDIKVTQNEDGTYIVDISKVRINGYTKKEYENLKTMMNEDDYRAIMNVFNSIESGEIPYEEEINMELQSSNDADIKNLLNNSNKNTTSNTSALNTTKEALETNNDYSYYITPDGTQTDIKIYKNVDL